MKECWRFWEMIGTNPCIDMPVFNLITHKVDPECSANQFKHLCGQRKQIAIHDLLSGMALLCQGQVQAKVRFVFALFDFTHSNSLSRGELCMLFASAMRGLCAMKSAPYPPMEGLERLAARAFATYALLGQEAMRCGAWKNESSVGNASLPLGLTNGAEGDLPLPAFIDLCQGDPAISALLSNLDTSVEATEAFLERMLAKQKVLLGELAEVDAALESAGAHIVGGKSSHSVDGYATLDRMLDFCAASGDGATSGDAVCSRMDPHESRGALEEETYGSDIHAKPRKTKHSDEACSAASRAACEMCSSIADVLALPGFAGCSGSISFDDVALLCHVGGLSLAKDLVPAFPACASRVTHSLRQEYCIEISRASTRTAATLGERAADLHCLRQLTATRKPMRAAFHAFGESVDHSKRDCDNACLRSLVCSVATANAEASTAQKQLRSLTETAPCTPTFGLSVSLTAVGLRCFSCQGNVS